LRFLSFTQQETGKRKRHLHAGGGLKIFRGDFVQADSAARTSVALSGRHPGTLAFSVARLPDPFQGRS